jgi:hypothetical protein
VEGKAGADLLAGDHAAAGDDAGRYMDADAAAPRRAAAVEGANFLAGGADGGLIAAKGEMGAVVASACGGGGLAQAGAVVVKDADRAQDVGAQARGQAPERQALADGADGQLGPGQRVRPGIGDAGLAQPLARIADRRLQPVRRRAPSGASSVTSGVK